MTSLVSGRRGEHVPQPAARDISGTRGLLDRKDLLQLLDRAVIKRLTVISAPPGSGKTSLLHAWADLATRLGRGAFVSVERDQQNAQRFWCAVLDAIRGPARSTACETPPAPTAVPDVDQVIDSILSEIAEHAEPVVLIIDDLHELRSTDALTQLESVLANLPGTAHVVLSSRRDPSIKLHQLRLANAIAEIRAGDLRFTEDETRELLAGSAISLSGEGVAALHQRTEGWAAGLRLAVISLTGHPEPERFVAEFSGTDRAFGEYLMAEMLERQPSEVQRMLLRTSLVDRMNGELADLLAGRSGSEQMLLALEEANAFVVSLDASRTWFRYHQLLADFLRLELRRTSADEVPDLHRRAARWFADRGDVVEAVRHMVAAGDWPDARRLLADDSFRWVIEQVKMLDASMADTSSEPPAMGTELRGVALLNLGIVETWTGRLLEAERHLSDGATLAHRTGRPYLEVACRAHQGFPSKLVSVATAHERGRQAVALAERYGLDDRPILAPALGAVGGMAIWMGEFDEGGRWLRRAWEVGSAHVEPATAVLLHLATGMFHAGRGQQRSALEAFTAAAQTQSLLTGAHALAPRIAGWLATTQARLGKPVEAHATLAGFSPAPGRAGPIANARAWMCLLDGNPDMAVEALRDVRNATPPVEPFTLVEAHLLAGTAYLRLGDRDAAAAAAEAALATAEPDRLVFPFAMTEAAELLGVLRYHETAHGALLTDIVDQLSGASPPNTDRQPLPHPDELTPSELRVLGFLPTNLTRAEIAHDLHVSIHTVNTHIRNLYAKLGAGDRSAAVQRARQLRLLSNRLSPTSPK